jgi:hypothetical protein
MNFAAANLPDADKRFLEVAFHVIDEGIRFRVAASQSLARHETTDPQLFSDMDRVVAFFQNTEPPVALAAYQTLLLRALSDQRAFLEDWRRQGPAFPEQTLAVHPRVQSASGALRAAYQTLIARYPEQGASNKDAFFDYHCALDFL